MSRTILKFDAGARYVNPLTRTLSTELAGGLVAACAGTLIGRAAVAEAACMQAARILGAGSRDA